MKNELSCKSCQKLKPLNELLMVKIIGNFQNEDVVASHIIFCQNSEECKIIALEKAHRQIKLVFDFLI